MNIHKLNTVLCSTVSKLNANKYLELTVSTQTLKNKLISCLLDKQNTIYQILIKNKSQCAVKILDVYCIIQTKLYLSKNLYL